MKENVDNTLVYVIRHGRTSYQVSPYTKVPILGKLAEVFLGQTDSADTRLSYNGIEMMHTTGDKLKARRITKLYSSDLMRARHSADILSAVLGIADVCFDERFREMSFGDYERMPYWKIISSGGRSVFNLRKDWAIRTPNGESFNDVVERVSSGVLAISQTNNSGNIGIVTHGATSKIFSYLSACASEDIVVQKAKEDAIESSLAQGEYRAYALSALVEGAQMQL